MTTEDEAGKLTEKQKAQLQGQVAEWLADCQSGEETFKKHFRNPDYDYWAKMDFWDFDEALLLSLNIKPPAEVVRHKKLRGHVFMVPGGDDWNYDNIHYKRKFDESYMNDWVRPGFSQELDSRKQLMDRASEILLLARHGQISPAKFVNWADRIGLHLPARMFKAVRKYQLEKAENSGDTSPGGDIRDPISGEERRELGMLKQQKEKWERAIEATVEAVLVAQKKKVTRDELTEHLDAFDLPFTTLEVIWKSLREKGFTKGPGRPTREKEKNP